MEDNLKIFVTGGSGFIGSHVVKALKDNGHETYIFDIQRPKQGISSIQGDLTKLEDINFTMKEMDAVCHLAATNIYSAVQNPILAAMLNVVGTANVMQAALHNQVRKVVYTSTWEIYGYSLYQPVDENHPCTPEHPYSITKLAGERLALSYDTLKGVPVIGLRLGTAYGPGIRPQSVFSNFINNAQQKLPIQIQGDGLQARQFTHVSDISRAFVAAVETDIHSTVFNIVAEENISIRQLADMVIDELPTKIVSAESRIGDPHPMLISSEKAKEKLGWISQITFQAGLHELISQWPKATKNNKS